MSKTIKGEIREIRRVFNEIDCKYAYEIIIDTEDEPKITLGKAEITQK
jgi:hypothetical protein